MIREHKLEKGKDFKMIEKVVKRLAVREDLPVEKFI